MHFGIRVILFFGSILIFQSVKSVYPMTELHTAIINNDLIKVKQIGQNTPSEFEKKNDFSRNDGITILDATALPLAILLQKKVMVETLLQFNANPHKKFTIIINNTHMFDATAIHLAANDLNVEIVDLLLEKKVDPNAKMKIGEKTITPAGLVSQKISSNKNARSILKSLMWNGAILPKDVPLKDGGTIPFSQILKDSKMTFEYIKHLVDYGTNPHSTIKEMDGNISSFLAYALKNSEKMYGNNLILFLLSKGANAQEILKTDEGEISLLALALKENLDYEIIQALLDKGANPQDTVKTDGGEISLLTLALKENLDYEIIRALLDKGANPQDTVKADEGEISLLALALKENLDYEIIQALLDKGANPQDTVKADEGEISLLALALKENLDYEIIQALLDKGANPQEIIKKDGDEIPLLALALKCDIKIIKALLDKKADKSAKVKILKDGQLIEMSILMFAINNDINEEVLELLFDENVDVNEVLVALNYSIPLIHLCITNNYDEIVKKLLQAGVNVNSILSVDGTNMSPLMTAIESNNHKITELLLSHGAIITQETMDFLNKQKIEPRDDIEEENYQKILTTLTYSLSGKLTILQNSLKTLKSKLSLLAEKLTLLKKRLVQVH